jgi:dihydrofolate reductase
MAESKPRISIVVAIGNGRLHSRALGKDNQLIWRIPDDLKRFRSLTRGHPVVMGRKTFESIVAVRGAGLPERPNIVITRDFTWHFDGAVIVHSLEQGIREAKDLDQEEIFIGGGADIYKQALPLVDKLYLTLIDDDKEGDTYFPEYEDQFTKKTFEESREWNGLKYTWVDLER